MVCAENNAVQAAKVLLEQGANVNHQDELGESSLHKALEAKADGMIELLVKNGTQFLLSILVLLFLFFFLFVLVLLSCSSCHPSH
jgi:ankyrin repeat protein